MSEKSKGGMGWEMGCQGILVFTLHVLRMNDLAAVIQNPVKNRYTFMVIFISIFKTDSHNRSDQIRLM